jgi:hypothetical protein
MGTLAIVGFVILLILVAIWVARISLQNDESGLFRRFLFMGGVVGAFIAAGLVGYGISRLVVAWLELDEKAAMFVQLGCFFVVLIAMGWTYDKLRGSWG